MIKICEMLGGSVSYGLNTVDSDRDERFVFINEEITKIIGLDRFDHLDIKSKEDDDSFGWEICHFFRLLKKNNTGVLEVLYNKNWINLDSRFAEIIQYKNEFLDLNRLYKCLKGYVNHEKNLAMGNRAGQIGSKRYELVRKFGYSPKNAVQGLRLMWTGCYALENSEYPVCVKDYDINMHNRLYDIKTNPQNYTKESVLKQLEAAENKLDAIFERNKDKANKTKFNEKLANELILKIYLPILQINENLR